VADLTAAQHAAIKDMTNKAVQGDVEALASLVLLLNPTTQDFRVSRPVLTQGAAADALREVIRRLKGKNETLADKARAALLNVYEPTGE
jgi:hypothetical protein